MSYEALQPRSWLARDSTILTILAETFEAPWEGCTCMGSIMPKPQPQAPVLPWLLSSVVGTVECSLSSEMEHHPPAVGAESGASVCLQWGPGGEDPGHTKLRGTSLVPCQAVNLENAW